MAKIRLLKEYYIGKVIFVNQLHSFSVGTLEKLEESLRLMEHTLPTFFSGVLGIYKEPRELKYTLN